MKFIKNDLIEINRELSDLDIFTLNFLNVLEKYTPYVIISGYVSILLGRARSSEDVDILIPRMTIHSFSALLKELRGCGFYCLNAEAEEGIFEYLKDSLAVRFAKNGTVIPNIEIKFAKNRIDTLTLEKTIIVRINQEEVRISHLEMQIAFKETVLKSPKDMEDARHIRNVAKGHLDIDLIEKYEGMLRDF